MATPPSGSPGAKPPRRFPRWYKNLEPFVGGDANVFRCSAKKQAADLERRLISRALQVTDGNRTKAAELLDLSYRALLYKIRDYGLD